MAKKDFSSAREFGVNEILTKITHAKENGKKKTHFFNAFVSKQTAREITSQKHRIRRFFIGGKPCFKVSC